MKLVTSGAPPTALTPTTPATVKDRNLRLPETENVTGVKKSTIYALAKKGKFPKPIKITRRLSVWRESEIQTWISEQAAKAAA